MVGLLLNTRSRLLTSSSSPRRLSTSAMLTSVNVDAWRVGLTAGYQITEGLRTLATVNYTDADDANTSLTNGKDSKWTGFVRLQRDF